jgi:hypothetical protein
LGPTQTSGNVARLATLGERKMAEIPDVWEAIFRAVLIGAALLIEWNASCAWYWRVSIFLGIMLVTGIIFHAVVQRVIAARKFKLRR